MLGANLVLNRIIYLYNKLLNIGVNNKKNSPQVLP